MSTVKGTEKKSWFKKVFGRKKKAEPAAAAPAPAAARGKSSPAKPEKGSASSDSDSSVRDRFATLQTPLKRALAIKGEHHARLAKLDVLTQTVIQRGVKTPAEVASLSKALDEVERLATETIRTSLKMSEAQKKRVDASAEILSRINALTADVKQLVADKDPQAKRAAALLSQANEARKVREFATAGKALDALEEILSEAADDAGEGSSSESESDPDERSTGSASGGSSSGTRARSNATVSRADSLDTSRSGPGAIPENVAGYSPPIRVDSLERAPIASADSSSGEVYTPEAPASSPRGKTASSAASIDSVSIDSVSSDDPSSVSSDDPDPAPTGDLSAADLETSVEHVLYKTEVKADISASEVSADDPSSDEASVGARPIASAAPAPPPSGKFSASPYTDSILGMELEDAIEDGDSATEEAEALEAGSVKAAMAIWKSARADAEKQIFALQDALRGSTFEEARQVARGIGRILSRLPPIDQALVDLHKAVESKNIATIAGFQRDLVAMSKRANAYLNGDPIVKLASQNPYGKKVDLVSAIATALGTVTRGCTSG